jgi:glutamate/aspartate transport system substrate-binding protein
MRYSWAAVLAATTLLALPAGAQQPTGTLKKIKETGEITIGYREVSVPFSYLDDKQQPVGFAMDICAKIVEAVKADLKLAKLEVKYTPVTSSSRIPLIANGTVDLECGSTTNNAERQKQVAFTNSHFLTAARYVTKVSAHIKKIDELKGKTVTSTAGTTNIKQLTEVNAAKNLGMTIIPVKDHAEGMLMVETDRAAAFFMDDIILAGFIANAKNPKEYVISEDATSLPEPYGIMLPKDDPAFKKIVDATTKTVFTSPDFPKLYAKWFEQPIPPKGINLNMAMTPAIKKAFANPTDNPDPKAY